MKFLNLFIILFLFFINCTNNLLQDDKLFINKLDNNSKKLKTDGMFYQKYGNSEKYTVIFLYTNGIILDVGGGYEKEQLEDFQKTINESNLEAKLKKIKFAWGLYIIQDDSIQFERWYPSDPPLKAYIRSGEIINDTTFVINESFRMCDGEKTEVESLNETYHFKQFGPKPDSTNSFIK